MFSDGIESMELLLLGGMKLESFRNCGGEPKVLLKFEDGCCPV